MQALSGPCDQHFCLFRWAAYRTYATKVSTAESSGLAAKCSLARRRRQLKNADKSSLNLHRPLRPDRPSGSRPEHRYVATLPCANWSILPVRGLTLSWPSSRTRGPSEVSSADDDSRTL